MYSGNPLRSVDRNGCALGSNSEAKEEAGNEEVPPCVREALPDTSKEGNQRGDEYRASTTEPLIELFEER